MAHLPSKTGVELLEHSDDGLQNKDDVDQVIIPHSREQKAICRKWDRRLLPIVCVLYVLSYLDRGNIGNAKTAGAPKALHLSNSQWTWVLNSFYISYVLFEWTNFLWKIFPAHIYVACLCVLWGTAAACSGATHNLAELIVCRVLLGIFEAGFGAGAPYFLSLFYQRRELGLRVSILLGMSPLASCFASALAYALTHIKDSLAPWRLIFIVEGIPTIAFAPVVYFFLADSPGSANYMNDADQTLALERLDTVDHTAKRNVSGKQFLAGLMDYQNYIHTLIHFMCNYSFAGLSNFLPSIVQALGYTSVQAQGLTAPAYLASFICCIIAAFVSDRYGKRGYIVAFFALMGGIGYLILATVRDNHQSGVRYLGIYLAACGVFPALAINITWLLNNQGGDSKKGAGLALLATFGQCSSFVSSAVFPTTAAPYYTLGCALGCGFTFAIVFLALTLQFLLKRENKRKDALYGPVGANVQVDVTQGGDKAANFRYMT